MDAENEIQSIKTAETQPMTVKQERGFRPTAAEIALAIGMYIIAYLYVDKLEEIKVWLIFFPLLYVIAVEHIYRSTPRSAESWIWLGSLVFIVLCRYFDRGRIWDEYVSVLSIHAIAVWWMLSRSGKLLDKRTGEMLPIDAADGLIFFPFGHFFMRLRTLIGSFGRIKSNREFSVKTVIGIVLALVLSVIMFNAAANALAAADTGFNDMLYDLTAKIKLPDDFGLIFFLSLPVGAYLFGQIAGSRRVSSEKLEARRGTVLLALGKIRIVPGTLWVVCSAFFCILYAAFIILQSSYLFGAFTRSLPDDFVVSEYARQGFFELCRVVVMNFLLYWLIIRTREAESERDTKTTKIMCTLILAASFLFTVIAMSKMGLYISNFSFTPRRIESCWLTVMLAAGCVAALYTLWTEKKTLRLWLMLAVISFSLLHIY